MWNWTISQAIDFQWGYRKSVEQETIAQLKEQLEEMNDWRRSQLAQEIDERTARYYDEHGSMPDEDDGGDATSEEEDDE